MKHLSRHGMTLVELLLSLVVFAFVMTAVTAGVISLYRSIRTSSGSAQSTATARIMADVFTQTLRQATYSDAGDYPLATIGSTTLVFFARTTSGDPVQQITFSLSGSTFSESFLSSSGNPPVYTGTPTPSSVSFNVQNLYDGVPVFRYFNAAGTEITNGATTSVRSIRMTILENAATSTLPDVRVETQASLYNLLSP